MNKRFDKAVSCACGGNAQGRRHTVAGHALAMEGIGRRAVAPERARHIRLKPNLVRSAHMACAAVGQNGDNMSPEMQIENVHAAADRQDRDISRRRVVQQGMLASIADRLGVAAWATAPA